MSSGFKKKETKENEEQEQEEGQVEQERERWKELIADLSIILKKFPREIAYNLTMPQAIAIKEADYRHKQFEGAIHDKKLPDKDTPRTEDGRVISSVDDLMGIAGGGLKH